VSYHIVSYRVVSFFVSSPCRIIENHIVSFVSSPLISFFVSYHIISYRLQCVVSVWVNSNVHNYTTLLGMVWCTFGVVSCRVVLIVWRCVIPRVFSIRWIITLLSYRRHHSKWNVLRVANGNGKWMANGIRNKWRMEWILTILMSESLFFSIYYRNESLLIVSFFFVFSLSAPQRSFLFTIFNHNFSNLYLLLKTAMQNLKLIVIKGGN